MITYQELQERNSDKLKRINCPDKPVPIKVLVFDKYHSYENSITKFKKTDLYETDEKLGIHGLHVGTVIQQLNSEVILYSKSYTSDFDSVVDYCIENNIRIINTSFSCSYKRSKNDAIKRYAEWGGIWISASGNEESNAVDFPASSEYTVGVSATNSEDSNGEEVNTTSDSWWSVSDQFDNYRNFNGTSCATPVISGVASYYLYYNPNGYLYSFIKWLNLNEIDDLDLVLDYDHSFGKLEEGEKFFVFPDDLIDKNVTDENGLNPNETVIKLYPTSIDDYGVIHYNGSINYFINNELYTMDTMPIIQDSRTLVPIRFVAEALNCEVEWDADNGEVKIIKRN